uniref:Inner mitochondrial membrane peptidase subunit 2 n=1 Tax=Lates calcarifer TaxID=8187 RepID=A0A4W6FDV8_LATCA
MAQQASAGRRYLRAFVSGFFVAVPVTVTVLDRFAYVARVEGASMQPFLNPEGGSECDVVLLNRWSVRNYQVQRGDIVSVIVAAASHPSAIEISACEVLIWRGPGGLCSGHRKLQQEEEEEMTDSAASARCFGNLVKQRERRRRETGSQVVWMQ